MKTPSFAEHFLNILFEGIDLDVNEKKEISYISDSILLVTGKEIISDGGFLYGNKEVWIEF